jgi:hypothetical protein
VWNTRYTRSSIRLCSTCILKLEGIAIATDRQDIEISFDDISGEPSTDGRQWPQIHLYNCELRRRVCAGPAARAAHVQAFARSLAWAGKQQLILTNYTLRGSKLRNRLMVDAVSTRRGRTFLEGSGWRGGYDFVSTRCTSWGIIIQTYSSVDVQHAGSMTHVYSQASIVLTPSKQSAHPRSNSGSNCSDSAAVLHSGEACHG